MGGEKGAAVKELLGGDKVEGLKGLLGKKKPADATAAPVEATDGAAAPAAPAEEPKSIEDAAKQKAEEKLKKLFKF